MAAISSTAVSNAASLTFDGLLKPLILRTNCSDAARISSSVTGGAKLNSGLMLLHMSSPRTKLSPLPGTPAGRGIGVAEIDRRRGNRQVFEGERSGIPKPVHVSVRKPNDVARCKRGGRVVRKRQDACAPQRDPHLFRSGVTVPGVHRTGIDDDPRDREPRRRRIL